MIQTPSGPELAVLVGRGAFHCGGREPAAVHLGGCRAAPSAMHSAGLGATTGIPKTVGAISAVGLRSGTATDEKELVQRGQATPA